MATVGSLVVDLVANTASFAAGMNSARSQVQAFQSYAKNVRFDIGGIEGASDLARGISDAADELDKLQGGFSGLSGMADAFSGASASAQGLASAIGTLNSALSAMSSIGAAAAVVGVGVAAVKTANWVRESYNADVARDMGAINAFHSEQTREGVRYRDFRMGVEMENASVPWSTELANKATQERARQDAIAAQRKIVTGQIDSIINPLKAANAKSGMSAADSAAYDAEQALLPLYRENKLSLEDFKYAVERAREEADKKAKFDASQLAQAEKDATDRRSAQEEASLIARIKESGMSDVEKFEREKSQIEALQRTDKITAEEASKAIATSSARLLRNAGGPPAPGQLGNGTPGAAALEFGTNQAFTAEVNKSTDVLQQILLEERLQRAANQRAADKLADLAPASVWTIA